MLYLREIQEWEPTDTNIVFVWSDKLAPERTIEQRPCLAPEIKIMWDKQLVDPPIDFTTSVNVPLVLN